MSRSVVATVALLSSVGHWGCSSVEPAEGGRWIEPSEAPFVVRIETGLLEGGDTELILFSSGDRQARAALRRIKLSFDDSGYSDNGQEVRRSCVSTKIGPNVFVTSRACLEDAASKVQLWRNGLPFDVSARFFVPDRAAIHASGRDDDLAFIWIPMETPWVATVPMRLRTSVLPAKFRAYGYGCANDDANSHRLREFEFVTASDKEFEEFFRSASPAFNRFEASHIQSHILVSAPSGTFVCEKGYPDVGGPVMTASNEVIAVIAGHNWDGTLYASRIGDERMNNWLRAQQSLPEFAGVVWVDSP